MQILPRSEISPATWPCSRKHNTKKLHAASATRRPATLSCCPRRAPPCRAEPGHPCLESVAPCPSWIGLRPTKRRGKGRCTKAGSFGERGLASDWAATRAQVENGYGMWLHFLKPPAFLSFTSVRRPEAEQARLGLCRAPADPIDTCIGGLTLARSRGGAPGHGHPLAIAVWC